MTAVDNSTDGNNGLPVITSAVTVEGNGATIRRDNTAPDFRIIQAGAGGNLTLNDLTVQGGGQITAPVSIITAVRSP